MPPAWMPCLLPGCHAPSHARRHGMEYMRDGVHGMPYMRDGVHGMPYMRDGVQFGLQVPSPGPNLTLTLTLGGVHFGLRILLP